MDLVLKNNRIVAMYPEGTLLDLPEGCVLARSDVAEKLGSWFDDAEAIAKGMLAYAHRQAAKKIEAHYDPHALAQLSYWYAHGDTSASGKSRITAVLAWKDTVWARYFEYKTAITNGETVTVDYEDLGAPPESFTSLRDAITA